MALWQIDFFVIPNSDWIKNTKFESMREYGFDDAPSWKERNVTLSFFDVVYEILPKGKSWNSNIIIFGNEDSNRMDVLIENNIVESVGLRIDFTSNYEPILNQLIEFFILNGLLVLDQDLNVVPLNFESFKGVIENAPQVKKYRIFSGQEKGESSDLEL